MDNTQNAAESEAKFDLNEVLEEAKQDVLATDSQTEKEPTEEQVENPAQSEEAGAPEEDDYKEKTKSRIQELLKDRKEKDEALKKMEDEFSNFKKELEERKPTVSQEENHSNIPSWFVDLYGYNVEGWKTYEAGQRQQFAASEERILQRAKEEIRREQEAKYSQQNAIDKSISEYAIDNGVDKNELKKYAADYPIFNQDGSFNLEKIHDIIKKDKGSPEKAKARKSVASINNTNADTTTKKDFFTPNDFR